MRRHSRFDWKGAALLITVTTLSLLLLSPETALPAIWLAAGLALALLLLIWWSGGPTILFCRPIWPGCPVIW